jgi:ubiquinone/menaquinone biosynthesis C-methylase UbiE
MDAPDADPVELRRSLTFIRRINAALGYTRATIGHLARFSAGWQATQTVTILDIATGSGDVPDAILRWAGRRGFEVHITGIDLHERTLTMATKAKGAGRSGFRLVRGDALRLPFSDASFDYALCSMFLHHLDDDAAIAVMREMNRVARRGVIIADLLRRRQAYRWISLLTLLSNPMVRHDARVSVAQAFNEREIRSLAERAGLSYAMYHEHFGHRFVLAGEKL